MKILLEVGAELFSMFIADMRMTLTTLVLVAIAAVLLNFTAIDRMWVGAGFLVCCLLNLIDASVREKRVRTKK